MNLKKAIENVKEEVGFEEGNRNWVMVASLKLLIAAGEQFEQRPYLRHSLPNGLLPGETKD